MNHEIHYKSNISWWFDVWYVHVLHSKLIRIVIKCKENESVNTLENIYLEIFYLKIIKLFFLTKSVLQYMVLLFIILSC